MSKYTLEQIDEDIFLMKERLNSGQGDKTSAMCRLSLDATEALRAMAPTPVKIDVKLHYGNREICADEIECPEPEFFEKE